jgi:hypothetical protein
MERLNLKGKGGSMFLEPGSHLVHIFEIRDNDKTPKPSIDVIFKNDQGQSIKEMFSLSEKAQWRLALLAIACGFATDSEDPALDDFLPTDMIGKDVMIQVVKADKYSEVKSFWKVDAGAQSLINGLKKNPGLKASPATAAEPPDADPF